MLVSTSVNNVAYFIVCCNIRVQGTITPKVLAHYCLYGTAFRFENTGKISSKVGSLTESYVVFGFWVYSRLVQYKRK